MSNPFDDEGVDDFSSPQLMTSPHDQHNNGNGHHAHSASAFPTNGRQHSVSHANDIANGNGRSSAHSSHSKSMDPAAIMAQSLMAKQMQQRHQGAGGNEAQERAARMFAASQQAAKEQEEAAAEAEKARLNGSAASAFNSRERNAKYSVVQQNQGTNGGMQGMGFPMTDMVDAANDKSIGLSFASLAVRDGPTMNAFAEEGVVVQQPQQAKVVQQPVIQQPVVQEKPKKKKPAGPPQPVIDPWSSSSFGSAPVPAPAPASVFRQPPTPHKQVPSPQPQQHETLMDFDPLSFGDMSNTKPKTAPHDPWADNEMEVGKAAVPKPKKKKVVVQEPSSSEEEEDDGEAERLAREKAARKAAKLKAQRERERAEAVAYDQARKEKLAREREAARSRAVEADDEEAQEVIKNETDQAKLRAQGKNGVYSKDIIDRWGANPAEHWAYSKSKTKTKMLLPKICVYWRFIWNNERHEVELFHSTVSGKRTVKCDGAIVASEKMFIDTGSRHDFSVGLGHNPCHLTVLICSSGSEYAYELFIGKQRFYQALQSWLIELQRNPDQLKKIEPLPSSAINTVGSSSSSSSGRRR